MGDRAALNLITVAGLLDMVIAQTSAISLDTLEGHRVHVEASLSSQLPGIAIIGLPDASLNEAKQRIRVACQNSDLRLSSRFITLNLSPADLPKTGSGFDLALALCALGASGEVPLGSLAAVAHIGELSLDGRLQPIRGVLPAVLAAQKAGVHTVLVPRQSLAEAELVEGVTVVGVESLGHAVRWHRGEVEPEQASSDTEVKPTSTATHLRAENEHPDMAEIRGQDIAIDALAIAAVGGHNVSMVGAPGTGKTLLASRIPSILPDLSLSDALEVTSLLSLSGEQRISRLDYRPPFMSPHHSTTLSAMVGGGTRTIAPGIISRASKGVLFLDEATEFAPSVLDALRQPLESGTISIHRANASATLPAEFMLILAANPCPCGNSGVPGLECDCTGGDRRRYHKRVSGPLRDRIDMHLSIRRVNPMLFSAPPDPAHSSAGIRARVVAARARTEKRLEATPWQLNREVSGAWLRASENLPTPSALAVLNDAFSRNQLTVRGCDRVLRLAWSIADLEGTKNPTREQISRAFHFRTEGVA